MTKTFKYPVVETTVWLQCQAPAGNWVDSIGFPYYLDSGRTMSQAIADAEASAKYHEEILRTTTRIVRKTIEVLC